MILHFNAKTGERLDILRTVPIKGALNYHLKDGSVLNQNEVLTTKLYDVKLRLPYNEYYLAWEYALQYCRSYDICTSKKWLPWEKKYFFSIYNLVLKRDYL